MKTKIIFEKLESLLSGSSKKKLKEKQVASLDEVILMLEAKENKFRTRLDILEADYDIPKYKRKLELTEIHIKKARAHRAELLGEV